MHYQLQNSLLEQRLLNKMNKDLGRLRSIFLPKNTSIEHCKSLANIEIKNGYKVIEIKRSNLSIEEQDCLEKGISSIVLLVPNENNKTKGHKKDEPPVIYLQGSTETNNALKEESYPAEIAKTGRMVAIFEPEKSVKVREVSDVIANSILNKDLRLLGNDGEVFQEKLEKEEIDINAYSIGFIVANQIIEKIGQQIKVRKLNGIFPAGLMGSHENHKTTPEDLLFDFMLEIIKIIPTALNPIKANIISNLKKGILSTKELLHVLRSINAAKFAIINCDISESLRKSIDSLDIELNVFASLKDNLLPYENIAEATDRAGGKVRRLTDFMGNPPPHCLLPINPELQKKLSSTT